MASNSKLTQEQKGHRKTMLAVLPGVATLANDGARLTILAVPDGSVTRVFSSVASPDEQKFRRKVGEYYALLRWWGSDENSGLILPGFWTAAQLVDILGFFGHDYAHLQGTVEE